MTIWPSNELIVLRVHQLYVHVFIQILNRFILFLINSLYINLQHDTAVLISRDMTINKHDSFTSDIHFMGFHGSRDPEYISLAVLRHCMNVCSMRPQNPRPKFSRSSWHQKTPFLFFLNKKDPKFDYPLLIMSLRSRSAICLSLLIYLTLILFQGHELFFFWNCLFRDWSNCEMNVL